MRILLRCQSPLAGTAGLPVLAGPGCLVLCAPQPEAVATAQRLYPDRRIEVKTLYREPRIGAQRGPFRSLGLLGWMLKAGPADEPNEEARRRVIDSSIRLIEVAKKDGEAVLVAGPQLLRLMAFKLNAIGYRGGFLGGFGAGEEKLYRYEV